MQALIERITGAFTIVDELMRGEKEDGSGV
jgi:hypothetical protein